MSTDSRSCRYTTFAKAGRYFVARDQPHLTAVNFGDSTFDLNPPIFFNVGVGLTVPGPQVRLPSDQLCQGLLSQQCGHGADRDALTSKVTGDHGAGGAPPVGVRVDRPVRLQPVHMFPISNRTGYHAKKRMRRGSDDFKVTTIERRTAPAQLTQKPPPLVLQLLVGDENALCGPDATKFGSIKDIASSAGFRVDEHQVTIDRGTR